MCRSRHQNDRKHYASDISLTIHVRLYGSAIIQSKTMEKDRADSLACILRAHFIHAMINPC